MNEDNSFSDDEPLNYEMNFLEEIKGHLEILSFDTTLHDIYEPVFSDGIHLSPKSKSEIK